MGSTHKLYKLKDLNISIPEVIGIMKKIDLSLCTGDKKLFFNKFTLTNPSYLNSITDKFNIQLYNLNAKFVINEYEELKRLSEFFSKCEHLTVNNFNPSISIRDYFCYSIYMANNFERFTIDLILPITDDFEFIQSEIELFFDFLKSKKLLSIDKHEIRKLIYANRDGYYYNSNEITFSAWANFQPRDSNLVRPSSIKLSIKQNPSENYNEKIENFFKFYDALNEYFSPKKYKIEGTFMFVFAPFLYDNLKESPFLEFQLPIFIDIHKNSYFDIQYLLTHIKSEFEFTIQDFDWVNSNPNHGDNRLLLWVDENKNWDFEICISKQIDEEYYFNIELLLNRELEFLGTV